MFIGWTKKRKGRRVSGKERFWGFLPKMFRAKDKLGQLAFGIMKRCLID